MSRHSSHTKNGAIAPLVEAAHIVTERLADDGYRKTWNTPAANAPARFTKKAAETATFNKITNLYLVELPGAQMFFEKSLPPIAGKLFDFMMRDLTTQNGYRRFKTEEERSICTVNAEIQFTTKKYMEAIGRKWSKPNEDKTKREITTALSAIITTTMKAQNVKGIDYTIAPISVIRTARGKFSVLFNDIFVRMHLDAPIALMPDWIFKLSGREGVEYKIARELLLRYSGGGFRKDSTHNIISVKALEKIAADTIPTEEEAKALHRPRGQILQRLENYLDNIQKVSEGRFIWEFCEAKKQPVADGECFGDYIKFEFLDFPKRNKAKAAEKGKAKGARSYKNTKKRKNKSARCSQQNAATA